MDNSLQSLHENNAEINIGVSVAAGMLAFVACPRQAGGFRGSIA
jgi:hypothetical protein